MNHLEVYQRSERWATIVSHLLISLMMVCLTISFTQLLGRFIPLSVNLPIWGALISGEAFLSYRVTRAKSPFSSEWLLARGAEWVVLLAVIKMITGLHHGLGAFLRDLPHWQQNFGPAFFTGEYISVLFILFTAWALSTLFTSDLLEMEDNEFIQKTTRLDSKQIDQVRATASLYGMHVEDETVPSNRRATHNRLLSRTLTVGVVMVIIAGLLRQDRISLWQSQSINRASVINVVLFFILSFALFSQTNFLALRAAWGYEHATIHRNLASRWVLYSLTFIVGLGIISFILPTRYSLGLLDTLLYGLGFLRMIFEFVIGVIMLPVFLLFRLLALLLGGGSGKDSPQESQLPTPIETPVPNVPVHTSLPWWDVFRSFLFWGVFIAILGFAVYQYLQQNQALLTALRSLPMWQWLKQAWLWLREQFRAASRGVKTAVQSGWVMLRALRTTSFSATGWRIVNPYRLTPRQQVIFFYQALVRRGSEAGLPRHPSQTPYEYARSIEPDLVEQTDAITELTEVFLDARYSRHEVTPQQASRVKQVWTRLRDEFKSKHRRSVKNGRGTIG